MRKSPLQRDSIRLTAASLLFLAANGSALAAAPQATINVNFLPPGAHGSYTCITWPAQAQQAFLHAAAIWSSKLRSAVPIAVDACYASMAFGTLNSYSIKFARNFPNAPLANTYYTQTLANALSGSDVNPAFPDIDVTYNADFGWHYGTTGNTPSDKHDFVSNALYVIGRALGMTGTMDVSGGLGSWGWSGSPHAYDYFTEDAAGQSLMNTATYPNPSAALANALQGGSVHFDGAHARAANGGARVELRAPATWRLGSSYELLADSFKGTSNALMTGVPPMGSWIHEPGPVTLGILRDLGWQVAGPAANADLSVAASAGPQNAGTGKDVVLTLSAANNGPDVASGVAVSAAYDVGATVIWASPGCARQGALAIHTCTVATLANGATAQFKLVLRSQSAGTLSTGVSVTSTSADPSSSNDNVTIATSVSTSPAAVAVWRYRLYSDVTKEHHFTTDQNEYNVLGGQVGTWVQEGTVGRVLNNPGSHNGVVAVPYYRLYNTGTQWHHWTTDANEYYTLGLYPGWNQEGVDGYLLPTPAAGTLQLYRLLYPHVAGGLHHWTVDTNEYNTLISSYGWIGEGGSGFVVQ